MHINPDNIRDMGSIGALNQVRLTIEIDGVQHSGLGFEASLDLVRTRLIRPIFETKADQDRRKRAAGLILISVRAQMDRGCWSKWLMASGLHQKRAWRWMKFADPGQVGINLDGTPRVCKGNGQEIGHLRPIAYPKTEQRSEGGVVAKVIGGLVAPSSVMISDEPYCPPLDDVDHGDGSGAGPGGGGEDDDDAPPFDGGDDASDEEDDEDFIEDDEDDLPLEDEETDEQDRGAGVNVVVSECLGVSLSAAPLPPSPLPLPDGRGSLKAQTQLSLAGVYRSKAAVRMLEEIVEREFGGGDEVVSVRDDELVAGWIGGTGERIRTYLANGRVNSSLAHGRGQAPVTSVVAAAMSG